MKKHIFAVHILVLLFIFTIFLLPTRFTFLAWNIILALVPYDLAILISWLVPKSKWLALPFVLIWLIFYPNTIYMITDFAHLSAIGTDLITSEQILNYSLLATGVFLGVSLGIRSARMVIDAFCPKSSHIFKLWIFTGLSILSSYAIYIGRYLRLNSWDLLVDAQNVVAQMTDAFSEHALHFIIIFTILQVFIMLISIVLNTNTQKNEQTP